VTAINAALGHALETLMSDLSEECCCAGWDAGTPEAVWDLVAGERGRWGVCGFASPEAPALAAIRAVSDSAGCWVGYGEDGRELVPLDEWRERMARR
jgi:hypothetical protein